MQRARISDPETPPQASKAELNSDILLSLIQDVWDPLNDTKVVATNTAIIPTDAILSLRFAASSPSPSKMQPIMDIQMNHCLNSAIASQRMKDHLESMQLDPFTDSIQSAQDRLGNYALQTPSSIFWVRDAIFASIDSGSTDLSFGEGSMNPFP